MSEPNSKIYKVLLVEDDPVLVNAITKKLVFFGFDVICAHSSDDAQKLLEDHHDVNAVWLDHYLLGKESGLDLVSLLKRDQSKWRNLPIFVISNTATEDKVKSYLHLGINKYYVKANCRLEDIIADIKQSLKED